MAKSVAEKLKLMAYPTKAIVDRPNESYLTELKDAQLGFPTKPVDLLFVFVKTMDEFKKIVHVTIEKELLNKDGVLFVAYPKKEIKCIQHLFIGMKFFQP